MSGPDVGPLCEWRAQQMSGVSHFGWHHGYTCPYDRITDLLAGRADQNDRVMEWRLDISRVLMPKGPPIPLELNKTYKHWAVRSSRTARIQSQVRRAARELEVPRLAFAHVEMHYQPKTRAHRDPDNLVPTMKAAIDGLHHPEPVEEGRPPVANPWVPVLLGDDPRYVSWSQPMIHEPGKERWPMLWLVLRSPQLALEPLAPEPVVQEMLL